MDFDATILKNREKKTSKNDVFFDCISQLILGGLGEDFGRILKRFWERFGASWRLLGHFLALFLRLVFRMLSKRALGGFRAPFWFDFGGVWDGCGEGFRRILGEFGGSS